MKRSSVDGLAVDVGDGGDVTGPRVVVDAVSSHSTRHGCGVQRGGGCRV